MKILWIFLISILLILVPGVSAHSLGQPPFFRVNGAFSDLYPVPTSSLADFLLPQDIARENFLVGEEVFMEVDANLLPVPKEIAEKTDFTWDFGDNSKASGLKNSHIYKSQGSYFQTIYAQVKGDSTPPQLLQSTLINVVSNENYKLPKAIIEINGFVTKDPLTDALESKFDKEFKFSAKKSESSSEIVEYIWDFGDGEGAIGEEVTHKYTTNPYTVFPVLRIKNKDGFISDAFVQIKEPENFTQNPTGFIQDKFTSNDPRRPEVNIWGKIIIGAIILALIYGIALFINNNKKK